MCYVFRENAVYWGSFTIALTFMPSILSTVKGSSIKEKMKAFLQHLPRIQLYKHIQLQRKSTKEQTIVKEEERKAIIAKCELRRLETGDGRKEDIDEKKKEVEKHMFKKDTSEKKLHGFQSELQEFKLFEVLGESYPQFVLQLSIILKKGLIQFKVEFVTIGALLTSLTAILVTFSGLIVSLPFNIYDQKRIPFKSLMLQYAMILPLTFFVIAPRLLTICTFFSLFSDDKGNAWISIIILALLLFLYSTSYLALLNRLVRKRGEEIVSFFNPLKNVSQEESIFLKNNFMTAIFMPIHIGNPNDSFYLHQNVLTTLIYSILSYVMLIMITFAEEYCNIPEFISKDKSQNQLAYQIICGVQVGALAIGVGAAYLISYVTKDNNLQNMLLWATQAGKDQDAASFVDTKGVNL